MEVKLASWIHLGLFIPETKHYILTYLKRKCKIPCSHQNHCLVYFLPKRLLPEDKLVETILFHQFLLLLQQRYNFVPLKLKQVSGNWKDLKSKGDGDRNLIAGLHGKRWQAVARAKRCHHSELECMQSEKLNWAALLKHWHIMRFGKYLFNLLTGLARDAPLQLVVEDTVCCPSPPLFLYR